MKPLLTLLSLAALSLSARAEGPDFVKDIAPILEASCVQCHHEGKVKGKLRMDTREMAMKGGRDTKLIVAGKPDESSLIKVLLLDPAEDEAMPPEGKAPRPDAAQIELLKKWIAGGAVWPDGVILKVPADSK